MSRRLVRIHIIYIIYNIPTRLHIYEVILSVIKKKIQMQVITRLENKN